MIKPEALRPGDTIGVIAPAGSVDPADLARGVERLEGMGFRVSPGASVTKRLRYLAGSDRERAADLNRMFSDPGIAAIVCARGGYGTSRIIPYLDEDAIAQHPKILVGSSDVTLLLNHFGRRFGLVTFHGPMVAPNFGKQPSPLSEAWFRKVLMEVFEGPVAVDGVRGLRGGQAEGPLVGGCLTMLCSTLGTPYEIQTDGAVLLLEDIDEAPYRIDRMLMQLKAASKFKNARGVIFGTMPGCQPPSKSDYGLEDVICDLLADQAFPVLYGFPAGHGGEQVTLPLGLPVRIDGNAAAVTLLEPAVHSKGGTP
ncbi:MAG: LD-carboxypeptidase [Nitrospirae bacterium]|nr:LD-carboxypeptidase [Nitrospirota bacterium]